MSYKSHLRIPSEGANYKYACHVERNAYPSMVISGVVNPYGVDCKNCKRTKAFDQSMKAAEAA